MNYKHIVFDVDGTLLDTADCILRSLQDAIMITDGYRYTTEELSFALGNTSLIVLSRLNATDPDATLKLWIENEKKYSDMIQPFNGIPKLLDRLSHTGYTLGIVTSRTREEFDLVFNPLDIHTYFSTIICSDDTEEHKPSPKPLHKYMQKTKTAPNEILYVGDTLHDMECAHNAGIDFALAAWGTLLAEADTEYSLDSPDSLLRLLTENH